MLVHPRNRRKQTNEPSKQSDVGNGLNTQNIYQSHAGPGNRNDMDNGKRKARRDDPFLGSSQINNLNSNNVSLPSSSNVITQEMIIDLVEEHPEVEVLMGTSKQ